MCQVCSNKLSLSRREVNSYLKAVNNLEYAGFI